MLIAEFIFLIATLYIGSRFGGMGLGVVSGVGLCIEVFVLRMPPASPPVDVMLIIIAVVSCASILEASGGLKCMLQYAERMLRKDPKKITFFGPLVTYCLTLMLGTGHAVYTIMPIIGDIALKNKIRPERPMAAASVASQMGLVASPISAVVACYLGKDVLQIPGLEDLTLFKILMVNIPATLVGVLLLSLYSNFRGKDLEKDPDFIERMKDPEFKAEIEKSFNTTLNEVIPLKSKVAVLMFFTVLLLIVLTAVFPEVRMVGDGIVSMSMVIQMLMLAFGAVILIGTKTPVSHVSDTVVFKSGMTACIAIFGIAWMADTYFSAAMPEFKAIITNMVSESPWTFAFALAAVSIVVNSQAATAKILIPVAAAIGLPGPILIGLMPATYAYFFIPNYPSDIATVNFDISGTTKIGKYYLNHSFMLPGLIGLVSACLVGVTLAELII